MDHLAAVKAIAWSPHQHGLLASGGGTADRCIRFWNTLTSQPLQCMDTGSQVCNLAWSKHANELVSVQIHTVHNSFAGYTLWHTFKRQHNACKNIFRVMILKCYHKWSEYICNVFIFVLNLYQFVEIYHFDISLHLLISSIH